MRTGLLLIDLQKGLGANGYYGSERNNPDAETNAHKLLTFFRSEQLPIYHVKHDSTTNGSPLFPGEVGNELVEGLEPIAGEPLWSKNVNSAFIGTGLQDRLHADGITHLVIVGLTTEHCVSTSTRMAANLGFQVTLISDATASFDKEAPDGMRYSADLVHDISLATLRGEFAQIQTTEDYLVAHA